VIFGRKAKVEEPEDDEEEMELVLFQGAVNGKDADLKANAKLVQAGLVRAKEIVSEGMSRRAEMIRIDPKGKVAVAAFYVDGVAYPAAKMPSPQAMAITQMLKLLAGLDPRERTKPQAGGIKTEYDGKKYVVRIDSQPVEGGVERLIVRVDNPAIKLEKPEQMGISEEIRLKVRDYSSKRNGVVLAVGPPMSGTSTTALGLMRSVDAYMYGIYNLADLKGRDLAHVTELKPNEGESVEEHITRARRQEPDVLLVDPIRDADRAKLIFDHAKHVSFVSEMTAKDAADAIVRLNAWLGDPKLTADLLKMVVSQKLMRQLCQECRQAYKPNPKLLAKVGLPPETKVLYRVPRATENEKGEVEEPPPCMKCGNLGYLGRLGLFEAIEMTDGMKQVVAAGGGYDAIKAQAKKEKMQSFQADGLRAVAAGKTSLEELQRVFQKPEAKGK
jgi:type II secretory ATPase GspE/PulE/Tfp pilus assembly ATPase PilB-like protein